MQFWSIDDLCKLIALTCKLCTLF